MSAAAREPAQARAELLARRALLIAVAAAALTAVLAGLARLGVQVGWGPAYAADHGALFVPAVFGTVIALERAVALGRRWGLLAPAAGAAAAVATLAGLPWDAWAAVASALALALVNAAIVRKQAAAFTWLMLAGSAVLVLGGVGRALGEPLAAVTPSWVAFFVLTIVAERLELSRLAPTPRWAGRALVALAALLGASACAPLAWPEASLRSFGVAMALLGAWQLRFDLARRTLRQPGLPRFSAAGVLAGAGWLVATGVLFAVADVPPAGPLHDAALHGVFVGYVLSMVFAHAPIILPAVARVRLPYHPVAYLPLGLLHASLLARVAGDLAGAQALRAAGAAGNALALAAFAAAVVVARFASARPGTRADAT